MKNNYNLINGLFAGQKKNSAPLIEDTAELPTTKRTFKILNAPWEDFKSLAHLKGTTQAELINNLIEQAVSDNQQEIEQYKELVNKK